MNAFLFIVWLVGIPAAWPVLYAVQYRTFNRDFPNLEWDESDRVAAAFFATVGAATWPLILALSTSYAAIRSSLIAVERRCDR